ncbi:hypothetical protein JCM10213v2_006159 [Rhodosporidiobolus nylandii]
MTASLVLRPSSTALRPRSPSPSPGANAAPDLAAHLAPPLPPSLPRRTPTPSPAVLNGRYPVVTEAEYLQNRGDFTLLKALPTAFAGDTHWLDWKRWQDYQRRDIALCRQLACAGTPKTAKDHLEVEGRIVVREKTCLVLLRLFYAYAAYATGRNVLVEDIWLMLELFDYTERPTLQERRTRFLQTFGTPDDSSLSAHPHAD